MGKASDFARLEDAVLNHSRPRLRRPVLKQVAAPSNSYNVTRIPSRYKSPPPLRAQTAKPAPEVFDLELEAELELDPDDGPPSAILIPAFMVLRGGATAPRGLASCVPFLVLVALTVAALATVALAIIAPNGKWG